MSNEKYQWPQRGKCSKMKMLFSLIQMLEDHFVHVQCFRKPLRNAYVVGVNNVHNGVQYYRYAHSVIPIPVTALISIVKSMHVRLSVVML